MELERTLETPSVPPSKSGYRIRSPHGEMISIPNNAAENTSLRFDLSQGQEIRDYYSQEGYVIVKELIPSDLVKKAYEHFKKEVKPYRGLLYRQASANPEPHLFTPEGYMLNSLLNLQDLKTKDFPSFKEKALGILSHIRLQRVIRQLFGEDGILVQSMFFEGNPATWAHQDSYYLDSSVIGSMTGVWVAAETIAPGAGRFYIYPKSHKLEVPKHGSEINIAYHHDSYKDLIVEKIRHNNLKCVAPALEPGDALFWSSLTIHGSLPTTDPEFSRASFTGHFIPESTHFLQYQTREKHLNLRTVNGVKFHFPKDQSRFKNRVIFKLETTFPTLFTACKRLAIACLSTFRQKV